jgi:NAD(P)H-dependent flavin oxidoreductase YrpB (nitropropane dioxygenase family)
MKHANAFAESIDMSVPIFQAPVGSVAGTELAVAIVLIVR